MNYRTLETGIKACLLIITAYIVADAVLFTVARGAMQTLPSFTMPEKVRKIPQPALPAVSGERTETSPPSDALPLIALMGTVSGAHQNFAVIFDTASKKQEIYKVKDDIGNGWHVHKIEKNRVALTKGGREESLEIKFTEAGQMQGGGSLKQNVAGNSVKLSPHEVEGAFSDLNKVMTQARVIPNIVDGKTSGYKIFNIIPDSIYTKIGLLNNDIIERVNGVEINSPDMFYQLFQQIRNENRVALDLKRGEERKSIAVEIR